MGKKCFFDCSTLSGHSNKNPYAGLLAVQYPVSPMTCHHGRRHSSSQQTRCRSRRPARVPVTIPDLASFFPPWITMTPASLFRWALPFASPPSVWPTGPILPRWEREGTLWWGYKGLSVSLSFFSPLFLLSPSLLFNYFCHTFTKGRRLSETPQVLQKSWVEGSGGGTKKNPSSNNLICPAVLYPQWLGWKRKRRSKKPVTPTMCRGRENVGGAADTLHTRSSGGVYVGARIVCVSMQTVHITWPPTHSVGGLISGFQEIGLIVLLSFITTREGKKQ